ncbi:MAG: DNA adenine methylase, partial [Candidatus Cloacimonetes bacterium]|nr:DNA adenine methylase [Candidatus Cloacimonadota bacterium]
MIFKAKPFIKWVGGKTQLLGEIDKQIMSLLSDNKDYTYIEPFVGGGAVLFWILQKYPNIKRAIINDLNHDLINTYKIVKDNPKELIESLSDIQHKYLSLQENDRKSFFLEQRAL